MDQPEVAISLKHKTTQNSRQILNYLNQPITQERYNGGKNLITQAK